MRDKFAASSVNNSMCYISSKMKSGRFQSPFRFGSKKRSSQSPREEQKFNSTNLLSNIMHGGGVVRERTVGESPRR